MEVDSLSDYGDGSIEFDFDDPALLELLDGPRAGPSHVDIALESAVEGTGERSSHEQPQPSRAEAGEDGPASLWKTFRSTRGFGGLSVTDLVSPLWCEFQHSYRLLSHSHLAPSQRPATILTPSGATLSVSLAQMVSRERILAGGTEMHKVIERSVMGDVEEVRVVTEGGEEWWALRVANTLQLMEVLLVEGRVRELPVWGFVGGMLVLGVIDEVERRDLSALKGEEPPAREDDQPLDRDEEALREALAQRDLPPEKDSEEVAKDRRWAFILSDTKTRHNASLPPKADSRPARLQLMLYHNLLSALLGPVPCTTPSSSDQNSDSTEGTTARDPIGELVSHLELSTDEPLSAPFLQSLRATYTGLNAALLGEATTLGDFFSALRKMGELLGGAGSLAGVAEIHYVLRQEGTRGKRGRGKRSSGWKAKRGKRASPGESVVAGEGAARRRSKRGRGKAPGQGPAVEVELDAVSPETDLADKAPVPADPALSQASRSTTRTTLGLAALESDSDQDGPDEDEPPQEPVMIGTETFAVDPAELQAWLSTALDLWLGKREPVGVTIDQTGRCRTCEFSENCEWLERKAAEADLALAQRRLARESQR